jgi:hypothetical protein
MHTRTLKSYLRQKRYRSPRRRPSWSHRCKSRPGR